MHKLRNQSEPKQIHNAESLTAEEQRILERINKRAEDVQSESRRVRRPINLYFWPW